MFSISMNTITLEEKINNLCSKLKVAGKTDTTKYFESLMNRIKKPVNNEDLEEALLQIIRSGKISDMANFSREEDRLLDFVYEEAKKLKK